jgi:hypothetical protein
MKKRSFIFLSVLTVTIVVAFFSCQKFDKIDDETNTEEVAFRDANFSPDFNWESSRIITLNVSSENSQVLNITSADNKIRYHKGILLDNSKTYVVKISVPTNVEKLSINNQELSLSSDNISVNL